MSAELVAGFASSVLVPGEAFFGFCKQSRIAPWVPEAAGQNAAMTEAAASAAGVFATAGCTVVHDGVVAPRYLPSFMVAARLRAVH